MSPMIGLPHSYLSSEYPGIGGRIREELDDFFVEEEPLYQPCGEGEHVYLWIEKRDLSTMEAVRILGHKLGRPARDFGYAGLKDRKGITRQMISLGGVDIDAVRSLELDKMEILSVSRHQNKLRLGHLRGNKFRIRIRGVAPEAQDRVVPILRLIEELGLPNYFGPQRFGNRGDAHWIGRAFLVKDYRRGIRRILGCPSVTEKNPNVVAGRYLFMQFRWREALERFPGSYREEKKILTYLLRVGEKYQGASKLVQRNIMKLYFSAFQAYLFNGVLEERMRLGGGDPASLLEGDIAHRHDDGVTFYVDNPEAEAERVRNFEISPTGPMFGRKMRIPRGRPDEFELEALGAEELERKDFHHLQQGWRLEGGRRPLRVPVTELSWSLDGEGLVVEFFLPRGSYATTLLRELMKNETIPPAYVDRLP
jgi:tRNA pseudouridine13 synthase